MIFCLGKFYQKKIGVPTLKPEFRGGGKKFDPPCDFNSYLGRELKSNLFGKEDSQRNHLRWKNSCDSIRTLFGEVTLHLGPLRTVKFRSFERPTPKKMVKRSYRRTTQWQSSWASIGQGRWVTFHDQLRVIFPPGCRSSQGIELTFAGSLAGSKIEGLKKSGCLTS